MGQLFESKHLSRGIDMATDEMASQPVTESQGRFEIHGTTTISLAAQGGAMKCLLTHIGTEPIRHLFRHGETDTINSNTVSERERSERVATGDYHSAGASLDPPHGQYQACEHRLQGSLWS